MPSPASARGPSLKSPPVMLMSPIEASAIEIQM